jgi:hypothetical protein
MGRDHTMALPLPQPVRNKDTQAALSSHLPQGVAQMGGGGSRIFQAHC